MGRRACSLPLHLITSYARPIPPSSFSQPLHHTVQNLSGGELQRVAIVLCLGKPADVYLIDEPSAYLDSEQRIACSKVIYSLGCVCLEKCVSEKERVPMNIPAMVHSLNVSALYWSHVCIQVIKRFIMHSKKTAFVVEHDFIMATYLADR